MCLSRFDINSVELLGFQLVKVCRLIVVLLKNKIIAVGVECWQAALPSANNWEKGEMLNKTLAALEIVGQKK